MHVVVIGAGILGASLAHALDGHGATVTVIDAAGLAAGATGASFGWINASFFADAAHFALRAEGIAAWRRLCHDFKLPVQWSGCLCWEEQGPALERQAAELRALGYKAEIVSRAEIKQREPHLAAPDEALFFADEAAVDAGEATRLLLAASGAKRLMGTPVSEVVLDGARVVGVRVPGGVIACDKVIVANGIGAPALLGPLGVTLPMLDRPGVIFRTAPVAERLTHICVAPIGEFRQLPDGSILMPTAPNHQGDDATQIAATPEALAGRATSRLRAVLPGLRLEWQEVSLAHRPVPHDGLPVIGACGPQGLYAAVMHSGVTLAAVVAEVLASEVAEKPRSNAQTALIAPYAADRFQSAFS